MVLAVLLITVQVATLDHSETAIRWNILSSPLRSFLLRDGLNDDSLQTFLLDLVDRTITLASALHLALCCMFTIIVLVSFNNICADTHPAVP